MITLFRIDERLIHGQIAIKWSKHYNINRIVVANDQAASSPLIQNTLRMAAPDQVKTAILPISKANALLKDSRCAELRILVLVDCPHDARLIVGELEDIKMINVGNYGRIGKEEVLRSRRRYSKNIYCNEQEAADFQSLIDTGIPCIYQTVPEEAPVNITQWFTHKGGI